MNSKSLIFDDVVLGGGSSGAVLASRMCRDSSRSVALLESGSARPLNDHEKTVLDNARQPGVVSDRNWKLPIKIKGDDALTESVRGSVFQYEGGHVLGGSSAVNAALAMRATPDDFNDWHYKCGSEWSWKSVLPHYKKLENDPVPDPHNLHGLDGPMPVRRDDINTLRPIQSLHYEVCEDMGFGATQDHNDFNTTGVGMYPRNVLEGLRVSTRLAYLDEVLGNENLEIHTGAYAVRLEWQGGKVCGIEYIQNNQLHTIQCKRVFICLGAIHTPAFLLRSGLGDGQTLKRANIKTNIELAGVGVGIKDHPVVGIWGIPKQAYCERGEVLRQVLLRYTSSYSEQQNDMHMCFMVGQSGSDINPRLAKDGHDPSMAGLTCTFNKSKSSGLVTLVDGSPITRPSVALNCLGDESDIEPLAEGVELAWQMLKRPEFSSVFEQKLAWNDRIIGSPKALRNAIKSFVRPAAHLTSSARMGPSNDRMSVVDSDLRIHGLENVWIGDASVMPEIPSAPPHLTVLMIAEKLASSL